MHKYLIVFLQCWGKRGEDGRDLECKGIELCNVLLNNNHEWL
jgi:hypothetical protein